MESVDERARSLTELASSSTRFLDTPRSRAAFYASEWSVFPCLRLICRLSDSSRIPFAFSLNEFRSSNVRARSTSKAKREGRRGTEGERDSRRRRRRGGFSALTGCAGSNSRSHPFAFSPAGRLSFSRLDRDLDPIRSPPNFFFFHCLSRELPVPTFRFGGSVHRLFASLTHKDRRARRNRVRVSPQLSLRFYAT